MEREFSKEGESEKRRGCLINEKTHSGCLITEKRGVVEEESSWADLPHDILCDILSRLFDGDPVIFRCVCKSWEPVIPLKANKHLLLNNCITTNTTCLSTIYLMYPNGKKVFQPIYDKYYHADLYTVPGGITHAVRDGWFLMTSYSTSMDRQVFFFHPLTNAKIDLPEFDETSIIESAYISAPPTSTSWMIIVTTRQRNEDSITIWVIKHGEERWKPIVLLVSQEHYSFEFTQDSCIVVCKGLYYFLGNDTKLEIYDPIENSICFHDAPESVICEQLRAKDAQHYLIESDGQVLAVFISFDGSLIRIFWWDLDKGTWRSLKSLGDKMLFVSRSLSMCERATIRGTGNKIYFPRLMDDALCFYSLSTKMYHTFASRSSYKSLKGSKYPRNPIWIKL